MATSSKKQLETSSNKKIEKTPVVLAVKCGLSETLTRMDIDGEVFKKTTSGGELFELILSNRNVVTSMWAFLPW